MTSLLKNTRIMVDQQESMSTLVGETSARFTHGDGWFTHGDGVHPEFYCRCSMVGGRESCRDALALPVASAARPTATVVIRWAFFDTPRSHR